MIKSLWCAVMLITVGTIVSHAQSARINLQRTITLPEVTGKFDHFAIDEAGHRLFIAATGSQSVEIIDLAKDKVIGSLKGLGKPHGLAWIPETGRLFVADGGKGELDVFDGVPLKLVQTIPLSEDADDMVYDSATRLLYVGHGGTNAANPASVAVVDARSLKVVVNLSVASHPEALELDSNGDRIFVNIADAGQIAVIDGKTHTLTTLWTLKNERGNTPLAYDAADDLLLVACRAPAHLVVLSGKTGEEMSVAATDSGADDLFYDASSRSAYLVAGSGAVDSFALSSDGKLQPLTVTHTANGAKTGLLVPTQSTLYVGIPGSSAASAIRVYQTNTK